MEFNNCNNSACIINNIKNYLPLFPHRTFAEYLVALWLAENWNAPYREMYIIFFGRNFKPIEIMFIEIVAKHNHLHAAIRINNYDLIEILATTDYTALDIFNRTYLLLIMLQLSVALEKSKNLAHNSIAKLSKAFEFIVSSNKTWIHEIDFINECT